MPDRPACRRHLELLLAADAAGHVLALAGFEGAGIGVTVVAAHTEEEDAFVSRRFGATHIEGIVVATKTTMAAVAAVMAAMAAMAAAGAGDGSEAERGNG